MKIVGGRLRGRRFSGPPSDQTRPTAERVREAVASALMARGALSEARVLDLYAGTGALSFEALSRGASHATLVEKDPRVAKVLKRSAQELGLEASVSVVREDLSRERAFAALERSGQAPFDLVFADPPYKIVDQAVAALERVGQAGLLAEGAMVVLEHASKAAPSLPEPLEQETDYRYGDSAITLATWAQG